MKSKAYCVLVIDRRAMPPVVRGASIFGEPCPTLGGDVALAELFCVEAETFELASLRAQQLLAASVYDWCGALKSDDTRGIYRDWRRTRG